MPCEVCTEYFNRSTRAEVKCPYCEFKSCSSCVEYYLLDTTQDAHCMNCRKGWSRDVLLKNLTRKFVTNDYKHRREELLLERERALLPSTQPWVEQERMKRRLVMEVNVLNNIKGIASAELAVIQSEDLNMIAAEMNYLTDWEARTERARRCMEVRKNINNTSQEIQWREYQLVLHSREIGSVEQRRVFVRACPSNGCRGFLSSAWKCGICEMWACPECHEVKGPSKDSPHTCDANNIATARLLDKDSKPCPKCASIIFKINGCDQMFCTQCHTAFSWRRGTIEVGAIHNPHYYEIQRLMGTAPRNVGDIPCGGMPNWDVFTAARINFAENSPLIRALHQQHHHIEWVVLPRYQGGNVADNRDYRIKFMIGDWDEVEFKRRLQQREKARLKKSDILQLLNMYQLVVAEIFQRGVENKFENLNLYMTEFSNLRDYINTEMSCVSKRYSCSTPKITEKFYLI
jgi:hypothetical protein